MPELLTSSEVTDEQRRQHNRHNHAVVAATLAVLCVYIYLFTSAAGFIGIPQPQEAAAFLHFDSPYIFDENSTVETELSVQDAKRFEHPDDNLLLLFIVIMIAFLLAYYLPVRYKQVSLALSTLIGVGLLYGSDTAAALLLAHLLVYLVFHPEGAARSWMSAAAGLAAYWAFVHEGNPAAIRVLLVIALPLMGVVFYRYALLPALGFEKLAAVLRTAVIHAAVLAICINLVIDALGGQGLLVPLGVMLFFFQWARLVMYHIDYQDGQVPENIRLGEYLAVFLSPGVLPTWYWSVTIPQGYAYVNSRFLSEDKNRIVLAGLKLMGIALLYLVFWYWIVQHLEIVFSALGVDVHRSSIRVMVHEYMRGDQVTSLSVLLTALLDLVRILLTFAGIVHFKVAVWRICGYNIAPYINKPWLATNLMAFWTRYAYYYREFLVRAFYYPVFFRFSRLHAGFRILIASLAAAGLGNLITHMMKQNLQHGMQLQSVSYVLDTSMYFLLLGLGIAVSMIFMRRRRRRRKAWTFDRWFAVDLLAAYVTIQYFALIHVFARPTEASTFQDLLVLFMLGLGIDLQ